MPMKKILIIEDEQLIALDMSAMLKDMGYEVAGIAGSGEEAVELAGRTRPDLALMDIVLAGDMDGFTAAAIIFDEYRVPVVYLTAHSERDFLDQALGPAYCGYLVKPVDKGGLHAAIETALRISGLDHTLRESETRFRRLAEYSRDIIFTADREMRLTYVSPSVDSSLGYSPDELLGAGVEGIMSQASGKVLVRFRSGVLAGSPASADTGRLELEFRHRNGAPVWCDVWFSLLRGEGGEYSGITGVARDVSERKKADAAYRRSELKYREMLDSMDDFVFTLDDGGILLYASMSSRAFFGMEPWQLIGTSLAEHVHPGDRESWNGYLEYVCGEGGLHLDGSGGSGEFRVRNEAGEDIWIEARVRPIRDGEGRLVACRGVARDITGRRVSETALRESERNFRLLVGNIHDGIFLVEENGRVVYANRYASSLTGYSMHELLNLPIKDLIKKEDLGIIRARYNDRLKKNSNPDLYETMLKRGDGEFRPIEVSLAVTEWKGRKADLIIFKDITERRKAEDGLRASLSEKDILIKEIHHRVKNNFQIVMSLLSLQGRSISDKSLADKFRDAQNRIRAMALIHEKLYQSEELSSINFAEYINVITGELHQVNARKTPGAVLKVRADNIRLTINKAIPCGLILNELVTNAFKYAFPAGFEGDAFIEVDFHEEGDIVELAVSDNGVGLPAHVDPWNTDTLGLNLVNLLSKNQLKGELLIHRTGSLKFAVRFRNG